MALFKHPEVSVALKSSTSLMRKLTLWCDTLLQRSRVLELPNILGLPQIKECARKVVVWIDWKVVGSRRPLIRVQSFFSDL